MPDLRAVLEDRAAREAALDIGRSVLVQAPAGSGKTDLLTRRFLRLLSVVEQPEEVLAITFTRAATAEMRSRILRDLETAAAARDFPPEDQDRMTLARDALANAEQRGWDLLNHPQRLAIETIDSLCLRIASGAPLLAGLSAGLSPVDHAESLYALAARRTLEHLGGASSTVNSALAHLLELRDNRLSDCESLIADMLAHRDHWAHAFPLSRAMSEEDWEEARSKLEAPFFREQRRVLDEAYSLLAAEATLATELLSMANYACSNGNQDVAGLAGIFELSPSFSVDHWNCLCCLVLTKDNEWRKRVQKPEGFPPEKTGGPSAKRAKEKMQFLLARLGQMPHLLATLRAIRALPPAGYSEAQWATLRHVFTVLRMAVAELKTVFSETGNVDFIELNLDALQVIDDPDRAMSLGGNVRHLLIDEFQDTSRLQHEIVERLLRVWEAGEGRTYFLVGDPMQSVYMFRQAEVELFAHVAAHGIGPLHEPEAPRIPCDPVTLSVNFRSHAGLTENLNRWFERICAEQPPAGAASVPFVRAIAKDPKPPGVFLEVHPQIIGAADHRPTPDEIEEARKGEAVEMLRILRGHLPAIERARRAGQEYRVAVLVRARPHLAQLVPLLRRERIPFRAVEIEALNERQELLDLLALTRALSHPMDRIAWLSVLRAPWCGLRLADLHRLTGSDDRTCRSVSVPELIERHLPLLSEDGQQRLARTAGTLRRALDVRWRQSESPSFSSWIERTWRTLGGPACVDAAAYENAQVFFSMLDALPPGGPALSTAAFDAELSRLFAQPDPGVSERCGIQLMTIHKAKGLGFDVVILPGLDRLASSDKNPLVISLERISPWHAGQTEFLVAPIGAQGEDTNPLFRWVRKQRQIRFDEELKRLLYVACTRARKELHLLGTAVATADGVRPESQKSLLAVAWPALREEFEAVAQAPLAAQPGRVLAFPGVLGEVAAEGDPQPGILLRRLPRGAEPPPSAENVTAASSISLADSDAPEFRRPQGSREARIVGSAVHALLQRCGTELSRLSPADLRARAEALLRAFALTGEALRSASAKVTNLLRACAADPVGQWILGPHPEAQSEASWSGVLPGEASRLRTLRADRVFRAGPAPLAEGADCFWIIDYKTGDATPGALFLASERELYAPQLAAYARALRALHGADTPLRLGLYYPAITTLDWWEAEGGPGRK